jgi:hypothetical protein
MMTLIWERVALCERDDDRRHYLPLFSASVRMVCADRRTWRLIGLGGGEFRLPLLMYAIGFDAR